MKKFIVDDAKIARAMNFIKTVKQAYADNGVTDQNAVLEIYGRAVHMVFSDVAVDVFETLMVDPATHNDPSNLSDESNALASFYHQLGTHAPFCVFFEPFESFVVERCDMNAATFIVTVRLDLTEAKLDPISLEAQAAEEAEAETEETEHSLMH